MAGCTLLEPYHNSRVNGLEHNGPALKVDLRTQLLESANAQENGDAWHIQSKRSEGYGPPCQCLWHLHIGSRGLLLGVAKAEASPGLRVDANVLQTIARAPHRDDSLDRLQAPHSLCRAAVYDSIARVKLTRHRHRRLDLEIAEGKVVGRHPLDNVHVAERLVLGLLDRLLRLPACGVHHQDLTRAARAGVLGVALGGLILGNKHAPYRSGARSRRRR